MALYIPEKIRVGFRKREDVLDGLLGYLAPFEKSGETVREMVNFDSWRDKNIPLKDYDNVPRSGYLINRGIQHVSKMSKRECVRVFSILGFEFEVGFQPFMNILESMDVVKKELVGDCVFAWNGKVLVLLPLESQEYRELKEKEELRKSVKSSIKNNETVFSYGDLIENPSGKTFIYLGKANVDPRKYPTEESYLKRNKLKCDSNGEWLIEYPIKKGHLRVETCQPVKVYDDSVIVHCNKTEVKFGTVTGYIPIGKNISSMKFKDPFTLADMKNSDVINRLKSIVSNYNMNIPLDKKYETFPLKDFFRSPKDINKNGFLRALSPILERFKKYTEITGCYVNSDFDVCAFTLSKANIDNEMVNYIHFENLKNGEKVLVKLENVESHIIKHIKNGIIKTRFTHMNVTPVSLKNHVEPIFFDVVCS